MITYDGWLFESSLRNVLDVPQNPKHHKEGSVARHTFMVRSALDSALKMLKAKQAEDKDGPLSNLDLNLTPDETNLLRIAALQHDIGKNTATDPDALTAYGHELPQHYEAGRAKLSHAWQSRHQSADPKDTADLDFVIRHHMQMVDDKKAGLEWIQNKSIRHELLDYDGKYKNERKVKVLLLIYLMDTMGRGGESDFNRQQRKDFVKQNKQPGLDRLRGLDYTAKYPPKRPTPPAPQDPVEFIKLLRSRNLDNSVIKQSMTNRYPNMPSDQIQKLVGEARMTFQQFAEAAAKKSTMKASIPLPDAVFQLRNVMAQSGYHLYVVGGAVRDFLQKPGSKPKDVDVCTDATPQQIGEALDAAGIRNFPKGEAFGVWVAHMDGEDFEIATLREDGASSDGRHPDQIQFASIEDDYKRRDMTMNALYYEIPSKPGEDGVIIDHAGGQGIEDAKTGNVKIIGDPYDRFGEDRLRILRVPRFHSQNNEGNAKDVIDLKTQEAMDFYKDLRGKVRHHKGDHELSPVSGERIQQEFLKGIGKARNVAAYLKDYDALGLLPSVFPGLKPDIKAVERLNDPQAARNPIIVLAALLRHSGSPSEVRKKLNGLNWPNDVTDEIQYLLNAWQSAKIKGSKRPEPDELVPHAEKMGMKPNRRLNVQQFGTTLHPDEVHPDDWSHFSSYEPEQFDGEALMKQHGIKGPAVGQMKTQLQTQKFRQSFDDYMKNR